MMIARVCSAFESVENTKSLENYKTSNFAFYQKINILLPINGTLFKCPTCNNRGTHDKY